MAFFRKPVPDYWRAYVRNNTFKQALIDIGVDAESAAEYLDDPNALPRELRQKLNEQLQKGE